MDKEDTENLGGLTIDLSNQKLRKVECAGNERKQAAVLILSDNEIQRLDNLESYSNLKQLFLVNNQIIRMFGVSHLVQLEVLDLSNNSLVTIEGLKDLKNLKELYLAKNRIKIIEHLNNNFDLEKLDLSDNNITHVSDISHLLNLKVLHLQGNKLTHLRQCEKNLPETIEVLTLHNNLICDLNEVSHLVNFSLLRELSFANNPCISFAEEKKPYIKNWCSSLIKLDGEPLDDIECLKAEWLYSQGRGRSFRPGEQRALVEYLINVCPIKPQNDEGEDFKKLKLILSKAQQHQKQLREQLSTGNLSSRDFYKTPRKKKLVGICDRMVTSYQDFPVKNPRNSPDRMTRSLDSGMIRNSSTTAKESHKMPLQTSTTFIPIPDTLISPDICNAPFPTSNPRPSSLSSRMSRCSSRNSPHSTPESKRKDSTTLLRKQNDTSSPYPTAKQGKLSSSRSSTPLGSSPGRALLSGRGSCTKELDEQCHVTSEEDDSEAAQNKAERFLVNCQHQKNNQKRPIKKRWGAANEEIQEKSQVQQETIQRKAKVEEVDRTGRAWKAAICIQRRWRGYRARNLSGEVLAACKDIQLSRMQEYIAKVVTEMEAARAALEGNRKLQVLQMQAINTLWKKMITLQPTDTVENYDEHKTTLQDLMATCTNLNKQVEELQAMMRTMQQMPGQSAPIATQTEIVAVHTPLGDGKDCFPYSAFSDVVEAEKNFSTAGKQVCSGDAFDERVNPVPDNEPDVAEIYMSENIDDNSSDQEVFLIPQQQGEKSLQYSSVKLSKPFVEVSELTSDIPIGVNVTMKMADKEVTETCSIENGCDS
ncbi:hypothetical protein RUM43_006657 [Polyplax serrata]|uniref:Centrosomal protein of 97 kDa n=1 Tax=Polyplax serrata TaxID=468196 RepID=A0AAN8PYX3_POLSC